MPGKEADGDLEALLNEAGQNHAFAADMNAESLTEVKPQDIRTG